MVGIQIFIVKFVQLCYMFENVYNKNVEKGKKKKRNRNIYL